jgi:hypothetical protein
MGQSRFALIQTTVPAIRGSDLRLRSASDVSSLISDGTRTACDRRKPTRYLYLIFETSDETQQTTTLPVYRNEVVTTTIRAPGLARLLIKQRKVLYGFAAWKRT